MQTLKAFLDQSLLIWKDSTAAARFGIALLLVICVGAIVGVGIWSSQPNYVVLADKLNPSDTLKMIEALDARNIGHVVKGSGTMILVDNRELSLAKMAAGDLGVDAATATLEVGGPFDPPEITQQIARRNLQRQLANTIAKYKAVESAEVLLSDVQKHVFVARDRDVQSASVTLTIARKAKFTDAHASAIAALVAHSVKGLATDQVAISDTDGRVYSGDPSNSFGTNQEEYRAAFERQKIQKAETMLTRIFGIGNAEVRVNAEFDFPNTNTFKKTYDQDGLVVETEDITKTTPSASGGVASGTAGATGNIGEPDAGRTGGSSRLPVIMTDGRKIKNLAGFEEKTEIKNSPVLQSMSVAVSINKKAIQGEDGEVAASEIEKITALISGAIGLQEETDQITVDYFDFVELLPMDEPVGMVIPWDQINKIVKNLSLGLAAFVALFVALKALKKIQPDPSSVQEQTDRTTQVSELGDLVKENPEVFSKIIESWSNLEPRQMEQLESESESRAA